MTNTPPVADVVCQLRRLLESIGDGLVEGRIAPLLDAERELGPVLHALVSATSSFTADPATHPDLRNHLHRCRAALDRCRRLGASIEDLVGMAHAQTGRSGAYTRAGDTAAVPPAATLKVRG